MLVDKQQPAEAARVLREHIAKHPKAVTERKLLIRVLGAMGDLGAAKQEAARLAALLGPNAPEPWIELGHAHELSHRYEDALALYDRAGEVAPRDARGPSEAGIRAAHWGELEVAARRLEEALRRKPADARIWHVLGLVRVALGDLPGARNAYRAGLKANSRVLANRVGLATLALIAEDPAEALVQYDAIILARPRFADAQLGRSWALIKLGRFAEAEQALGRAAELKADPKALRAQQALLRRARAQRRPPVESN
jgi:tetratricopeptide (TPR) repeat protein